MNDYFYLEESLAYTNKYLIKVHIEKIPFPHGLRGSYEVLQARLMGLDFASFLRYCRDKLGAEIIGKNQLYVVPYFDKTLLVQEYIKVLNTKVDYIMSLRKIPYEFKIEAGNIVRIPLITDEDNSGITE